MLIPIFAIAIAVLVSGKQLKNYIQYKKFLKSFSDENNVEIASTKRSIGLYIQQLIPVIVCIVCAVYIYIKPDLVKDSKYYITFFIMLAVIFIGSLFTGEMYNCVHYTEEGFLWENSYIRFSNIRELKFPRGRAAEVDLKNGKSVKVTKRQLNILREICDNKKIRIK